LPSQINLHDLIGYQLAQNAMIKKLFAKLLHA
jgi:hypothetical protein